MVGMEGKILVEMVSFNTQNSSPVAFSDVLVILVIVAASLSHNSPLPH